ncbi:glycoside hydrolase family 15 protein [Bdellovibrionota bacterium FG-1]
MQCRFIRVWRIRILRAFIALSCFGCLIFGKTASAGDLDQWIFSQSDFSVRGMLRNIGSSPAVPDAVPGSVVAAPSRVPDYRFHWVRDGALTMDAVLGLFENATDPSDQSRYLTLLLDYVGFSRRIQLTANASGGADELGVGEPKFRVDGRAYELPWGRPQNDGPALRALTLIRFAHRLVDAGRADLVWGRLYNLGLPGRTVIKVDLEFVSDHWRDPSFDLWEEVKGSHFYTRLVQRRALLEGAALADRLGDPEAAKWYRGQASAMEPEINRHWRPDRGIVLASLDTVYGKDYGKNSGLDVAVVLGALHASASPRTQDQFFGVTDDRILATAARLAETFKSIYLINTVEKDLDGQLLGPAIGRYPEDVYSGSSRHLQGNPWFLATNAFAELYYRCARQFEKQPAIRVTPAVMALFRHLNNYSQLSLMAGEVISSFDSRYPLLIQGLRETGDSYLRRVRFHSASSGSLSEQFNRDTGYMQSAEDLTWSYASVLTAVSARGN